MHACMARSARPTRARHTQIHYMLAAVSARVVRGVVCVTCARESGFARMLPFYMHRDLSDTQVSGTLASLSQLTALTGLYVRVIHFVCVSVSVHIMLCE